MLIPLVLRGYSPNYRHLIRSGQNHNTCGDFTNEWPSWLSSLIHGICGRPLTKQKRLKWPEVKWLQDTHHKDKDQVHGTEEEDHSVEDVADSMQYNNPQDKVQSKCNNSQHNKCKVNQDKWGSINAEDAKATVIGLMIALPTDRVMEEAVEEDICEDVQEEEDEEEEVSNEVEDGIRQ